MTILNVVTGAAPANASGYKNKPAGFTQRNHTESLTYLTEALNSKMERPTRACVLECPLGADAAPEGTVLPARFHFASHLQRSTQRTAHAARQAASEALGQPGPGGGALARSQHAFR